MPVASRTFRIFVSSTFEDLIEERNALQHDVFPKLTSLCEAHGVRFQAIDLRWGVRDEAVLGQKMMDICLAEIERCQRTGVQPNFIVLTGDRYGTTPLPARIAASEFELLSRFIAERGLTLLKNWYQRDDNAVPPEYLLKPRTGDFVGAQPWMDVEEPLRETLRTSALAAGLDTEALLKYNGSASHQEIARGLRSNLGRYKHTLAFFRISNSAIEDPRLAELKHFLKRQLADNALTFSDVRDLCSQAYQSLERVILSEIAELETSTALSVEISAHAALADEHARNFTGRVQILESMRAYFEGDNSGVLFLLGPSGSGKSAIMARASKNTTGGAVIVRRFIGATPDSSSGLSVLRSICDEISDRYGFKEDTPVDFDMLVGTLRKRLELSTEERPLHLLIDAVDQLGPQDPAGALTWLPTQLPPHCRVAISTIDLPAGVQHSMVVEVSKFLPTETADALRTWLAGRQRTLQPSQMNKLLRFSVSCGYPLYIKIAFEESCLWRSFDTLEACALPEPNENSQEGIFDVLFDRLSLHSQHGWILVTQSLSYLASSRHGLTESEIIELLTRDNDVWADLLQRAHFEPPSRQLPVVIWSRLFWDLEPYLTERDAPGGTVISFYHRRLVDQIASRYLGTPDQERTIHFNLAEYFQNTAFTPGQTWDVKQTRALSELPFHLWRAGRLLRCAELMIDFDFIRSKMTALDTIAVLSDFAFIDGTRLDANIVGPIQGSALKLVHRALSASANALKGSPEELSGQLFGRLGYSDNSAIQEFLGDALSFNAATWLRPIAPALTPATSSLIAILAIHRAPVICLGPTLRRRSFLSASTDGLVVIWDDDSGEALHKQNIVRGDPLAHETQGYFYRPPERLSAIAVSTKGLKGLVCLDFKHLRILNIVSGETIPCTLDVSHSMVRAIAVNRTGSLGVVATGKTIHVVDLEHNATIATWSVPVGEGITLVAISENSERLYCAVSGNSFSSTVGIAVCDLISGKQQLFLASPAFTKSPGYKTLYAGTSSVDVTLGPEIVVNATSDAMVRTWNYRGEAIRCVDAGSEYHQRTGISAEYGDLFSSTESVIAWRGQGEQLVWALGNRITLWDLSTQKMVKEIGRHTGTVRALYVLDDGSRLISASEDATVRLWDLEADAAPEAGIEEMTSVTHLAASYGGAVALFGRDSGDICRFDPLTGKIISRPHRHSDALSFLQVSGDGTQAMSASPHEVVLWSTNPMTKRHSWKSDLAIVSSSLVISRNWRWMAATGQGGASNSAIILWDFVLGEMHVLRSGNFERVAEVGDDGQSLLLTGLQTLETCRVVRRERTREHFGKREVIRWREIEVVRKIEVREARFITARQGSKTAYFSGADGSIILVETASGNEINRFKGGASQVCSLTESRRGELFLCGRTDGTLEVWNITTGAMSQFLGHTGEVTTISVDNEALLVVTGGTDRLLILRDLKTGKTLARFRADGEILQCFVSTEGNVCALDRSGRVICLKLVRSTSNV